FTYNIVASRCVAYTVVALLSEVNTIFLHSRKLLQMHKCPFDHWIYRLNALLNLVTFVCCRFLCNAWITYGMLATRQRVSIFYFWILAAAMFVMWVTNVMLFWRLVQSD
ncbi:hypothetical protein HELRODRAFT_145549, partial [Helobdella robusta]|uniref:TLC domain-containing protein n=1 Tax=Helobdella robusta TaxID=6412 RepID=T1EJL0_HELRO